MKKYLSAFALFTITSAKKQNCLLTKRKQKNVVLKRPILKHDDCRSFKMPAKLKEKNVTLKW
jgi:hypothetical protein